MRITNMDTDYNIKTVITHLSTQFIFTVYQMQSKQQSQSYNGSGSKLSLFTTEDRGNCDKVIKL